MFLTLPKVFVTVSSLSTVCEQIVQCLKPVYVVLPWKLPVQVARVLGVYEHLEKNFVLLELSLD